MMLLITAEVAEGTVRLIFHCVSSLAVCMHPASAGSPVSLLFCVKLTPLFHLLSPHLRLTLHPVFLVFAFYNLPTILPYSINSSEELFSTENKQIKYTGLLEVSFHLA